MAQTTLTTTTSTTTLYTCCSCVLRWGTRTGAWGTVGSLCLAGGSGSTGSPAHSCFRAVAMSTSVISSIVPYTIEHPPAHEYVINSVLCKVA